MTDTHKLWVEKYRPETIDAYIFHDPNQKAAVMRMINDKSIPHLLFSGSAGTGKTTLARILVRAMEIDRTDVLILNSSDENSVDVMRDKIKSFISTVAFGPFKIVYLEEADRLTPHAQEVMRNMMEAYADHARFILTCNHENRITAPIKSRCQHFHFKAADQVEITEYCINILAAEKVKFSLPLLEKYVAYGYPDIRKIINLLQQNTVDDDGEFEGRKYRRLAIPTFEGVGEGDWKFSLLDLIEANKWTEARLLLCEQVIPEEWEEVYRFLYENLDKAPKFQDRDKWEEGIIIIAEFLYKHGICADPEINAASMLIQLGRV